MSKHTNFLKKLLPPGIYNQIRNTFLFRPEDPWNLHQQLPPTVNPTQAPHIKGFRSPAPGSRVGARVPVRESSDQLYDIKYYTRDPTLMPTNSMIAINTSNQPLMLSPEEPRLPSHGKRKISLLDYDPTGLRTTKTTTWETTGKELEKWKPNHLPEATWMKDIDNILQECERKGIPVAVGKRYRPAVTPKNYNTVRW